MFRGNFEHNLNGQGRVSLPARFRQVLEERYSNKLVLVGLPDRIEAYPEEAYRKRELEDMDLPADDPRVLQFLAVQHHNVFEVEVDGQGRILIPPKLRADLELKREVVFIGLMDRVLVFSPERWRSFLAEAKDKHAENGLLVSKLKNGKVGPG
jgi:MraZ protein